MNAARYFIRRADDEPPRPPRESPFRKFDVKCLKCQSHQLRLVAEYDEQAGEIALLLKCQRCRQQERLAVK